jgi:hypothetical protein
MNPLIEHKEGVNYWDVDNQLMTIEPFKSFYKKDSSKQKNYSSQHMWAVAFYIHPKSRINNYSSVEKQKIINDDISNIKLDWEIIEKLIPEYIKLYSTQVQRSLEQWKFKLEERDEFLMNTKYSALGIEDAGKLDKLLSDTPKLFEQYAKIVESLKEEENKGINRGNRKESISEKKLI